MKETLDHTESFDRFWAVYPRRIAKGRARKAWQKLKPDEGLLKEMLSALELHKTSDQWCKDGGRFIPHPATWLNDRRWEDEMQAADPFADLTHPATEEEVEALAAEGIL